MTRTRFARMGARSRDRLGWLPPRVVRVASRLPPISGDRAADTTTRSPSPSTTPAPRPLPGGAPTPPARERGRGCRADGRGRRPRGVPYGEGQGGAPDRLDRVRPAARFAWARVWLGADRHRGMGEPPEPVRLRVEERPGGVLRCARSNLPAGTSRVRAVRVWKPRWRVEQGHPQVTEELGLDHFEGRRWRGGHHHPAEPPEPGGAGRKGSCTAHRRCPVSAGRSNSGSSWSPNPTAGIATPNGRRF